MHNKITYRQQFTRCGKQRCRRCRDSDGHGPYWYAYWSEKGRTVSKYIGVSLPPEIIAEHAAIGETAQEPLQKVVPSVLASTSPILRIYLLGQFRVERKVKNEWKAVDNHIWQRRRARSLLGCLLSTPSRRLGREQVIEQLWPDLDIDVASNRLNGAVHELRQILEPDLARPATSRMLRLERDILELADTSTIWVDVEAFETLLKEADNLDINIYSEQVEHLLAKAESLYSGGYLLEELYSEWATHRRDALQRRWVGLLLQLADLRVRRGAFVSAIETLDRLRVADPTNETALQALMRLLTQLDRRGEALHVYRQHVTMMQREYESEPLPETRAFYEALRKGKLPETQYTKPQTGQQQEKLPHATTSISTLHKSEQNFTFIRPTFQRGRQNQSPLVGRNRERLVMQHLVHSLTSSSQQNTISTETPQRMSALSPIGPKQPHFLLLTGDSGIGKTRLAEELSHEATTMGWAVAWSRAYEQEGNIAYHSWIEIVRLLIQNISIKNALTQSDMQELYTSQANPSQIPIHIQLERLSTLLPEVSLHNTPSSTRLQTLLYEQDRLYLWEAILGLLTTLSTMHPLLLVLDDLHWADDSSIELLTYLTHHVQDQHILFVGTCRDSELHPAHKLRTLVDDLRREQAIVTLPIQPLTQSQIGTLVSYLPQEIIESIQTQAAGNPFFAEELARYIATQENHEYFSHHSLPDAVAALLERRLRRLSNDCQTLLSKAAVLGGSFELRQLLPMTSELSEDTVLDLLDEALREGLLTEVGTGAHILYHFWHPLIVSHLYERLSAARRAHLHRRAAEAIKATQSTQEKVAAAIFNHLRKGGGNLLDIAHFAELAGNQAYSLTAYVEAHYYYLQAILACINRSLTDNNTTQAIVTAITTSLTTPPVTTAQNLLRLCRLLELSAECCFILGNFEEARTLYECILALRTGPLFTQHIYSSSINETLIYQQEAQIQALLWREIVLTWKAIGAYDNAHEGCKHGKEVLLRANITSCPAWACLHLLTGAILRYEGSYQEARRYSQEAITMLEQFVQHIPAVPPNTPFAPIHAIKTQITQDHSETTHFRTRTERALHGDPVDLAQGYELMGVLEASIGHIHDAQRFMRIALAEYEKQERFLEVVRVYGNLGAVSIMQGKHTEARIVLNRALNLAERSGDLPNIAFITGNLGDVAYRSGDLLEAETWLKRSLVLAEKIHDREHISWCCVVLADVQQALGYLREATTNLHRAIRVGRAIKNSRCIRFALVSLGDLRIVEAMIACKLQPTAIEKGGTSFTCQRLLRRAKSTLQRAISQADVEIETIIDCKLLLATVSFLNNDLVTAKKTALQTLQEAQEQETTRVIGRAQRLLGRILAEQGNYDEANTYFEQAMRIFHEQELRLDYARTLHGYGLALVQRSTTTEMTSTTAFHQRGLAYLHEARILFNNSHATIDFSWVDLVLSSYTANLVKEGVL